MVKMSGRTETDGICKQILENLKIFQKEIYEAEDKYQEWNSDFGLDKDRKKDYWQGF